MFVFSALLTLAALDFFSLERIFPHKHLIRERYETQQTKQYLTSFYKPSQKKEEIKKSRSTQKINIKKGVLYGLYFMGTLQGTASFLNTEDYKIGIQDNKPTYDRCPVPLRIYPSSEEEANTYFGYCVKRACNRYKCPLQWQNIFVPIFEWTCPFLICVPDSTKTYSAKSISPKEQNVIEQLAFREKRCWQSTCHKFGKFFSPELSMPHNKKREEKLNQCFAPVCKLFSTNRCINGYQGTGKFVQSNVPQILYHMFQSICNTTLCPGRFVETRSFALREPVTSLVEKLLGYCKRISSYPTQKPAWAKP